RNALPAANTIDGNTAVTAMTEDAAGSWFKYDRGAMKIPLSSFSMFGPNEGYGRPQNYIIQGSNDDATWTNLFTASGGAYPVPQNAWRNVTMTAGLTTPFRYIKFLMVGQDAIIYRYLQLGEIEMYGTLRGPGAGEWIAERDAPADGGQYVRKNNAWAVTPNMIVLGPTDPVPGGTPAGTVIIRTA